MNFAPIIARFRSFPPIFPRYRPLSRITCFRSLEAALFILFICFDLCAFATIIFLAI
jgi:hypothetical protein